MSKGDVRKRLEERSADLERWLTDVRATVEQWKFSIDEGEDGTRIEFHAVALLKHPGK